jgi:hypothetical protein
MEKKGSEVDGRRLLKALGARAGEGKGGGSARCRVGVGEGAERGPAQRSAAWSSRQWPPAIGCRRRCYGATGEGGGAQLTRRERLTSGTGRHRGLVASGGVREGEEEARQWRHRALTGGAIQHSAACGLTQFKLKSKFKRGQMISNLAQTLTASNRTFPDSTNLK